MTGYESKRAAARDKLIELAQEGMSMHSSDAPEYIVCKALIEALEQTAQEPKSITYNEVADAMNSLRKGNFVQKAYAEEVGKLKLYTTPPQRKPLTIKQEQKAFEKWWIKEIGDKDDLCASSMPKFTPTFYAITRVEYAWLAWQARAIEAAHGIKEKNT